MSTTIRLIQIGAGTIVIVFVFFLVRWSIATGTFNHFSPVSPGVCRVLARIAGPEDFEIDPSHKVIFVSSTDRHAARPAAGDGIYLLKWDDPKAPPVKLAGTPPDFHPHGISLYRNGGEEMLFAVNHHAGGMQSVDSFIVHFDGDTATLEPQASIAGGLLVSPNDVAAVGPGQFYVTNDHVTTTAIGRFAEDYLIWPHADLVHFNGAFFRIAIQRIAFPNGVYVTPDGTRLYVTSTNERRVIGFSRSPYTGELAEIGSLHIPARLDNISMDPQGELVIAGHPSLARVHDFQKDAAKPSPSVVFKVHLDPVGAPQSYQTVYANDGAEIGGSSSAAIQDGRLIIGSVLDNKLLDCRLK